MSRQLAYRAALIALAAAAAVIVTESPASEPRTAAPPADGTKGGGQRQRDRHSVSDVTQRAAAQKE